MTPGVKPQKLSMPSKQHNFWVQKKSSTHVRTYLCILILAEESMIWEKGERESRHLIRINIIKGKIHSSGLHRKKKLVQEKIDKLINKRLKAFQLRQWTKCFCSLCKHNSGHFYHVLFAIFFHPKKKHIFIPRRFRFKMNEAKYEKLRKWKIQLKLAPTIVASMILGKAKKKIVRIKAMWISTDGNWYQVLWLR